MQTIHGRRERERERREGRREGEIVRERGRREEKTRERENTKARDTRNLIMECEGKTRREKLYRERKRKKLTRKDRKSKQE